MLADPTLQNESVTHALRLAIRDGDFGIREVPSLLKRIIEDDMWQCRTIKTGQVVIFDKFAEYVTTPPLEGLGATVEILRKICQAEKDIEALDKLDDAIRRPPGGDTRSETAKTIGLNQPNGQREQKRDRSGRTRHQLHQEFPDLYKTVIAGEKTVTKAAVEAGVYPRRIAVNLQSPASAAATLRKAATPEFLAELRRLLA
jgi:hypothetical protein